MDWRFYRFLRHWLATNGQDISKLPENLSIQPGDSIRAWCKKGPETPEETEKLVAEHLAQLREAGWDGTCPPNNPDAWVGVEIA
ncbi:MAG: hypothetical protein H7833_13150 [Magnetococcus sp. DMHC-1]